MTRIDDYDYLLPPELIAQTPSPERDASRLLTIDRATGEIGHHRFRDILQFLRRGDLLVLNDTRVIPARIAAHRPTGGRVRALLVERLDPLRWLALLDSSRRLKEGERLSFGEGVEGAIVERRENGKWLVEFSEEIEGHLRRRGEAPLPPYIRRPEGATTADSERYQTVYAEKEGAIAAPTAGLHFTRELLAEATANGIEIAFITLHVGMGTFKPIACEEIEEHRMEAERFAIDDRSATAIENARRDRRRIIAVGTTSCRTLEAYARSGERSGATDLFIRPPFDFRLTGGLITNFHLPKSTLLLLVSAFAGREKIMRAYEEAIRLRYRFYSYGDAMFIGG